MSGFKIKSNVSGKQYRSSESILQRNMAERKRAKSIAKEFEQLREVIPFGVPFDGRKKTRIETLLGAIQHIRYLESILESDPIIDICNSPNSTISQVSDLAQFPAVSAVGVIPDWDHTQLYF